MRIDPPPARREWKYRVPTDQVADLMGALRHRTEPDPHCAEGADGAYVVRSLYFDTPDLRFYHEKKDGLKVRRKLRVRNYGDDLCFLEIKRKIYKKVLKERVALHRSEIAGALNGEDPATVMSGRTSDDLRTLERFRFNMMTLGLIPTALITYRRRAVVGRLEPSLRVTLDSELRSRTDPGPDGLFDEARLLTFEDRCVLEFKFDDRPPRWLLELGSCFQLRREPFSKYCQGIDRWSVPTGSNAGVAREGPSPS